MCQVKESHPSTSKGVFVLEQTANSITHGVGTIICIKIKI